MTTDKCLICNKHFLNQKNSNRVSLHQAHKPSDLMVALHSHFPHSTSPDSSLSPNMSQQRNVLLYRRKTTLKLDKSITKANTIRFVGYKQYKKTATRSFHDCTNGYTVVEVLLFSLKWSFYPVLPTKTLLFSTISHNSMMFQWGT